MRLAGCLPGDLILDAGCGNGRHAPPLARLGYRVVGLDRAAVLLGAARRESRGLPWPRFVSGSYAATGFKPGTFDAVFCLGSALGYLGESGDRAALCEFQRVLAPGGRLVIETLHRDEIGVRLAEHEERQLASGGTICFDRRIDRVRGTMRETQWLSDEGPDARRGYEMSIYRENELRRMLERAGFEIVARHGSLDGTGEPSDGTPLVLVAETASPLSSG